MQRRQFLRYFPLVGMVGAAGCSEVQPGANEGTEAATSTPITTDSPTREVTEEESTATPQNGNDLPWSQLPGPPGGPVTDVTLSRVDPDWMYATTITAGIFVSSTGGSEWIQGLSGMHHRSRVWVSPHDPQVAYTQERTDDGGRHWYDKRTPAKHRFPLDGQLGLGDLAWDPVDQSVIYAATVDGFYRTLNAGRNWESYPITGSDMDVAFIDVHPNREGVLIAGVPNVGVARSDDYGESWTLLPGSDAIPEGFRGLVYGDPEADELFLAFNTAGVYRLLNGNLERLTDELAFPWWTNQLRLSADRRRLYFIGGPKQNAQWDGWWERRHLFVYDRETGEIDTVTAPEEPSAVRPHPDDPSTVFVGGKRWVFESNDGGETWSELSEDFIDGYLSTVEVNSSHPETVVPGSQCSTGITVSHDHGDTYEWKRSGLEPWHGGKFGEHYVNQIRARQDRIYATTGSGLLISSDNGATWELLDNQFSGQGGHDPREPFTPLHGLAVHPSDPDVVIVGSGRAAPGDLVIDETHLWKSTDGGSSWVDISAGFPTDTETIVRNIVFSPDNRERVYAATVAASALEGAGEEGVGAGIYKSENGGAEWAALETPFENVHTLSIAPIEPAVLYASTPEGLYRSANRGRSWEHVLDFETRAVLAHPGERGVVFAGSKKYENYWDVLVSDDGGETWAEGNLTIQIGVEADERAYDAVDIHSDYWNERGDIEWFSYDQSNSLLYAATRGTGLWRTNTDIIE